MRPYNFIRASLMVQNTLYNREWEQKKGLQEPLYTSNFFLLMNNNSSGLVSYCSFFKSFFYYNNWVLNKKMLKDV